MNSILGKIKNRLNPKNNKKALAALGGDAYRIPIDVSQLKKVLHSQLQKATGAKTDIGGDKQKYWGGYAKGSVRDPSRAYRNVPGAGAPRPRAVNEAAAGSPTVIDLTDLTKTIAATLIYTKDVKYGDANLRKARGANAQRKRGAKIYMEDATKITRLLAKFLEEYEGALVLVRDAKTSTSASGALAGQKAHPKTPPAKTRETTRRNEPVAGLKQPPGEAFEERLRRQNKTLFENWQRIAGINPRVL